MAGIAMCRGVVALGFRMRVCAGRRRPAGVHPPRCRGADEPGAGGSWGAARRGLHRRTARRGYSSMPTMSSGRTGAWVRALPVAARTAATTAGVEDSVGGSPAPRSP